MRIVNGCGFGKNKEISEIFPKANHHCWAHRIEFRKHPGTLLGCRRTRRHCGAPDLGHAEEIFSPEHPACRDPVLGGIKLRVRGLIEAYGEAAELAKDGSVEMEFSLSLGLSCSYEHSKTLISSPEEMGFQGGIGSAGVQEKTLRSASMSHVLQNRTLLLRLKRCTQRHASET